MKAQASLEMVVGLIILLVVAGVVIGLVLHFLKPGAFQDPEKVLQKRGFLGDCETYCKDESSVDFCRYYFGKGKNVEGGADWNENKIKNELIIVGSHDWPTCEDRVYCFLIYTCDKYGSGGIETIDKCKQVLCQTYREKYGNNERATVALKDTLNWDSKSCSFATVDKEENWYDLIFKDGCR